MWKIKSGIPYCEKCGYTPSLTGLVRECSDICPQCGDSMLPEGFTPVRIKNEPISDEELLKKLKITYEFCCNRRTR